MIEETLRRLAAESPGREVCGFVLVDGTVIPATNIAQGTREFEICHKETIEVFQEHGGAIRGVYHSHPSGSPYPSWRDVRNSPPGLTCIIATADEVVEWVIENDGASVTRSAKMAGKVRRLAAVGGQGARPASAAG